MSNPTNYEPILPPLPKPLQSSKYWDRGIEWALAGERAVRLEREDQLRESLAKSRRLKAEVERLGERVRMAEHYFASPESFSNEEFQAVGAVVTDCPNYSGKVPYLDEVERIREEKWPKELTPELTHILGLMCFRFIGPAQLFRAAGYTIPEAAEDEQAFMLHRLLGFWFTHGKDWHLAALEDLRAIRSLSAAKEESRG